MSDSSSYRLEQRVTELEELLTRERADHARTRARLERITDALNSARNLVVRLRSKLHVDSTMTLNVLSAIDRSLL